MTPHLDLVILLVLMMMMMMMDESEADMGATRLVRFEKKPDSIYRAVRIWSREFKTIRGKPNRDLILKT